MQGYESIVVACSDPMKIVSAVNAARGAMPPEPRKRLGAIFSAYLAAYDVEGVYERMANRTVSQIFGEYQPPDLKEVVSGEIDGVRYRLYEPRPSGSGDGVVGQARSLTVAARMAY